MIYHEMNWWLLFCSIPIFFLQCTIHELSHGISISFWKWSFKIYPYPHKLYNTFYFARCDYIRRSNSLEPSEKGWAFINIAPRVTNTLFMVACYVSYLLLGNYPSAQTILLLIGAAQVVDGVVGVIAIFCWWEDRTHTDILKFYKYSGLQKVTVQIISAAWSIGMLLMVLVKL